MKTTMVALTTTSLLMASRSRNTTKSVVTAAPAASTLTNVKSPLRLNSSLKRGLASPLARAAVAAVRSGGVGSLAPVLEEELAAELTRLIKPMKNLSEGVN